MNVGVKTTISTNRHIYDQKGNYLPSGNYYFFIKKFDNNLASGNITCKGEFGEFIFESSKVIKMMAIAQARLARRANLKEEGIPTYASPISSPSHAFYNTNNIVQEYENNPTVSYTDQLLTLPTSIDKKKQKKIKIKELNKCMICLDYIKKDKKNLSCFHSFHNNCIKEWLVDNINCPICRKEQPFELIYDIVENSGAQQEIEQEFEQETEEETEEEIEEEIEEEEIQENRIIRNTGFNTNNTIRILRNNYVNSSNYGDNLFRQSNSQIRERYSLRRNSEPSARHNYNLRPRSEI